MEVNITYMMELRKFRCMSSSFWILMQTCNTHTLYCQMKAAEPLCSNKNMTCLYAKYLYTDALMWFKVTPNFCVIQLKLKKKGRPKLNLNSVYNKFLLVSDTNYRHIIFKKHFPVHFSGQAVPGNVLYLYMSKSMQKWQFGILHGY